MPKPDLQILDALSELTISLRNCNLNTSILNLRAPRVDFEASALFFDAETIFSNFGHLLRIDDFVKKL